MSFREDFDSLQPSAQKGMLAIMDLRDLLAAARVDHATYMEPLSVLAKLCGELDTYKTFEQERNKLVKQIVEGT
jgi:hypothetical protein